MMDVWRVLFDMFKSDELRFINGLHTTVRQPKICSEICKCLGQTPVLYSQLSSELFSWSSKLEESSIQYRQSHGKLTISGKPTTALRHYLDFAQVLGLITEYNGSYLRTRLGSLCASFYSQINCQNEVSLNSCEVLFYFFLLLYFDADGLLLIMDLLNSKSELTQKSIQLEFSKGLIDRIIAKREGASLPLKIKLDEKFRAIKFQWKNPDKYAEHLISSRSAWLIELGFVGRIGKNKSYGITEHGAALLSKLPIIGTEGAMHDMDIQWFKTSALSQCAKMLFPEIHLFKLLNETSKAIYIAKYLEKSVEVVPGSASFKRPLFESILYTCINIIVMEKFCIDFNDVEEILKANLEINGKRFTLKDNGRWNESYIFVENISH